MKLLVIGSGGREHALVWKLAQSPHATRIWCAPGNGGIAEERVQATQRLVECVKIGAEDLPALLAFAFLDSTLAAKVPLFTFSSTLVQQGALAALVVDPWAVGKQAARASLPRLN